MNEILKCSDLMKNILNIDRKISDFLLKSERCISKGSVISTLQYTDFT